MRRVKSSAAVQFEPPLDLPTGDADRIARNAFERAHSLKRVGGGRLGYAMHETDRGSQSLGRMTVRAIGRARLAEP
jgi:hypothetical protein